MNDIMRDRHMERITDDVAIRFYDMLCAACESREGGMCDADQEAVADAAMTEQMRQMLIRDIETRGLGAERSNGRQKYYQKNESVAQLKAYTDQKRRQMAELKLTPASRKAEYAALDDEFDDF